MLWHQQAATAKVDAVQAATKAVQPVVQRPVVRVAASGIAVINLLGAPYDK
jgi:hypothetical protein